LRINPGNYLKMKVSIVALLVVLAVAVVSAGEYGYRSYYQPGFRHVHEGIAAAYRNDYRQQQVNHIAEHYGAGTGTARFVGVPGTNGYYGYRHYGGHGYGAPHYGGYGAGYGYGH
jgi:hypothetical protein